VALGGGVHLSLVAACRRAVRSRLPHAADTTAIALGHADGRGLSVLFTVNKSKQPHPLLRAGCAATTSAIRGTLPVGGHKPAFPSAGSPLGSADEVQRERADCGIMRVNFVHLRPGGPHNA
jgi:hypothetical protein